VKALEKPVEPIRSASAVNTVREASKELLREQPRTISAENGDDHEPGQR
jgi:hypothetical protein